MRVHVTHHDGLETRRHREPVGAERLHVAATKDGGTADVAAVQSADGGEDAATPSARLDDGWEVDIGLGFAHGAAVRDECEAAPGDAEEDDEPDEDVDGPAESVML